MNNNMTYCIGPASADFISLSHHCGGILTQSSLKLCVSSVRFVGICLCTGFLRSRHSISVFFLYSFLSGFIFACVYAALVAIVLLNGPSSHLTLEYFATQTSSRPTQRRRGARVATKQAQINTPPPLPLTVGRRCLCWYAVSGFHITAKDFHFGLAQFFRRYATPPHLSIPVLFNRGDFPWQPFHMSHICSVISVVCAAMNFNI